MAFVEKAIRSVSGSTREQQVSEEGASLGQMDRAAFYMLRLYRTNLEIRLKSIDPADLGGNQKEIYNAVVELLKQPLESDPVTRDSQWNEIYKAERLIGLLSSGPALRQDIDGRLHELSGESVKDAESLRREYELLLKPPGADGKPADDVMLRRFLLKVMEMLHWSQKKKYLTRTIRKGATRVILVGVAICFVMVVLPYLAFVFDFEPGKRDDIMALSRLWTLLPLYVTVFSGALGAFFFRLVALNREWPTMKFDEVFLHRDIFYTFLRAGVGVCGALIVYFFLQSGFITGSLVPNVEHLMIRFIALPTPDFRDKAAVMVLAVPSKDLALLTIWTFLAGFSESLVPSILSVAERQVSSTAAPPGPSVTK